MVGAGIVGATIGYDLARSGTAGIISALGNNLPHPEWSGYAFPAMRYYLAPSAELEGVSERDHSFRVMGELKLAAAADPEKELEAKLAQRQVVLDSFGSEGIGTNVRIGRSEIRQIRPLLEGVELAMWHDQIGNVDGRKFRRAILNAVQKLGGKYVKGPVELRVDAGRVRGVDIDGELLAGDVVILATGSWSGRTLASPGLSSDVCSMRGQITLAHLPGVGDVPPVVGATREKGVFELDVTVDGLMQSFREDRIIPSIEAASVIETRVRLRPVTPDRIPHLGWASSIERLLMGLGISFQGRTLGAYDGAALVDQTLGSRLPSDRGFSTVHRTTHRCGVDRVAA